MNFEEWFGEYDEKHQCYPEKRECYEAGAQSQQSKIELLEKELTETQAFLNKQNHIKQSNIDCMKVELDGANERAMMMFNHKNAMVDKMQSKIDELQAKIDDALNTLCKLQYSSGERIYNDVGNILKGNKDEN